MVNPTMYLANEKANHSIENASTVSSIYGNIQDFDRNKTLKEVSQEPVPVSLNATFQRPPCPDPMPATFALAAVKVFGVRRFVFYNKIEASNRSG